LVPSLSKCHKWAKRNNALACSGKSNSSGKMTHMDCASQILNHKELDKYKFPRAWMQRQLQVHVLWILSLVRRQTAFRTGQLLVFSKDTPPVVRSHVSANTFGSLFAPPARTTTLPIATMAWPPRGPGRGPVSMLGAIQLIFQITKEIPLYPTSIQKERWSLLDHFHSQLAIPAQAGFFAALVCLLPGGRLGAQRTKTELTLIFQIE
jgi:hypothetical protein